MIALDMDCLYERNDVVGIAPLIIMYSKPFKMRGLELSFQNSVFLPPEIPPFLAI